MCTRDVYAQDTHTDIQAPARETHTGGAVTGERQSTLSAQTRAGVVTMLPVTRRKSSENTNRFSGMNGKRGRS